MFQLKSASWPNCYVGAPRGPIRPFDSSCLWPYTTSSLLQYIRVEVSLILCPYCSPGPKAQVSPSVPLQLHASETIWFTVGGSYNHMPTCLQSTDRCVSMQQCDRPLRTRTRRSTPKQPPEHVPDEILELLTEEEREIALRFAGLWHLPVFPL